MGNTVRQVLSGFLNLLSLLLLVRAIMSWFPTIRGGRIMQAVYFLTEPFLLPFRSLFDKLGLGRGFPIDLSFLATIVTIQLLRTLIVAV